MKDTMLYRTKNSHMKNYQNEFESRVTFIRNALKDSGAQGVVYGNSGGKDSALVGILCKAACENTLGVIMPCGSSCNCNGDMDDAKTVAEQYKIDTKTVNLSRIRDGLVKLLEPEEKASANIAPRLRMITLYAFAASENRLVAGTGNRSEGYMGYFTKWGDGAYDFNPIADLTVTEIYEFLRFLKAPESIINKAPSAGLFDGQTDEAEMGVTYSEIDDFLLNGKASKDAEVVIAKYHITSEHKRRMPLVYLKNRFGDERVSADG